MTAALLTKDEYLPYFKTYIDKAGTLDLIDGLQKGLDNTLLFFKSILEEKFEYVYEEGKWTIKELINHLIDTERIFCYRAMRFARADKTPLPGFNENDYATASNANSRTIEDLLDEYKSLRASTIYLYKNFTPAMLLNKGVAGSGAVSVRALGFLIIGHEIHHKDVIEERYL